ncbi:Major facilitator sugar transporter-like [Trinorchestia longiramus]|nr:Major facilitator sugar transporter-like [Trinorchestia longiramus]
MSQKTDSDVETVDCNSATAKQKMLPPEHLPLDDVITSIGFGMWTLQYFTLATLIPMSMLVNLLVAEFTAVEVGFTCNVSSGSNGRDVITPGKNISKFANNMQTPAATITNVDAPLYHHSPLTGECYKSAVNNTPVHERQLCTSFLYDNETFLSTITTEVRRSFNISFITNHALLIDIAQFDLVCSREWQRSLFQMLFTLGCLFGAPVGGIFADKYGRQRAMWYGCLTMVALTALLAAVPLLPVVFLCRFLLGFFTDIVFIASITIGLEVCPNKYRHAFGTVESLPYALMLPLLAGIAYLCRDWRPVQLWASVPLFAATLLASPLLLDESPRWLVLQGQVEEAEKAILRAAKLNRSSSTLLVDLRNVLLKTHKDQLLSQEENSSSLFSHLVSLMSTAEMRRLTLVLAVLWFFEGTLYISLPLNASTHKSPFLYMALLGLLEMPGTLVVTPLGGRYGRKRVGCACAVTTAAMMLVMAEWLLVVLAVVAYITLVGVSQMTLLLTAELFPTNVRSLGSSVGFFMNNLGYCVPPLIEILLPELQQELTLLIYGIMAFSSACLLLLLPETNKRPLFETVSELVKSQRRRRAHRLSTNLEDQSKNMNS